MNSNQENKDELRLTLLLMIRRTSKKKNRKTSAKTLR